MNAPAILSVENLSKQFLLRSEGLGIRPKTVQAVSNVSFELGEGRILGIVGESGCGKSTTARLLMGLIRPDAGRIQLQGREIDRSPRGLSAFRRNVQMVFQDSSASLNPRLTIESSVMFGPIVHGVPKSAARETAHRLLDRVGLQPARFAGRYPHELSGGQRQRVNIARALALEPRIVIFDEAVSALDKSIEAQVLNLLLDLKSDLKLSYIFISHDLNVVRYISDDVLVMYLGEVVEYGPAASIYARPAHPYTRALLASMPSLDPDIRTTAPPITGDPPSPIEPPPGCRFHPRCAFAEEICRGAKPDARESAARHFASCFMLNPASGHSRAGAR